jgi:hypothetical protein
MILAHAFGVRYELPIPLKLFVIGGGLVVVASFLLIARRTVSAGTLAEAEVADVAHVRALRGPALIPAILGVLLLGGVIAAGLTGSQEIPENILPTIFWIYVWVLMPLSAGVLGDWTQELNPMATLAKVADRPGLRKALVGNADPIRWPRWLGWWPAVVAYFAIVCAELIYNVTWTVPRNMALALLVYAVMTMLGGLLFGRAWLERGEVFTVLFATWGRLGYFRFGSPGRRGFAGGLEVPFLPVASRIVFVLLLLVSVNFDGLLNTPTWAHFVRNVNAGFDAHPAQLHTFLTVSFAALAVIVFLGFGLFAYAAVRAGGFRSSPAAAFAVLLPSLLPIAFGYLTAHYLQYVMINGQLIIPLIGNPTGHESWPIHLPYPFNDNYEIHNHFLPNSTYWYVALVVIVLVHVAAVLIAHRNLGHATTSPAAARRSEYPWLAAMVGYTMLSLWLIAQPLTKEKATPANGKEAFDRPPPMAVAAAAPWR